MDRADWSNTNLTTLTFGYGFNQDISKVVWSNSLKTITFGWIFNQEIGGNVVWPNSLTTLTFGDKFNNGNKDISNANWPNNLTTLDFGDSFNQDISNVNWPDSLTTLIWRRAPYSVLKIPSLQRITIRSTFDTRTACIMYGWCTIIKMGFSHQHMYRNQLP